MRGLDHCRAAQALQDEISRREQPAKNHVASLLANADFNPNEARDRHGQWTTNATGTATNRPSETKPADSNHHTSAHADATKDTTPKPKTGGTASGTRPAPAATLPVEKIALSTNEPALMIERLLLAETLGVKEHKFNQADALKNIKAIGALIYNRAHAQELGFTFKYPTNLVDVIRQKGQFAGFGNYNPKDAKGGLNSDLLQRIDACVQGANDPKDKRHYTNFVAVVKQAKATAEDVIKGSVPDPFSPNHTFTVRTSGHAGPGGSFKPLGSAAGNDFYGFTPTKPAKK